jgi:hypothetical protein
MNEIEELLHLVDDLTAHLQQKRDLMREMARCVREGEMAKLDELLQQHSRVEDAGNALNRIREELCERIATSQEMKADEVTLGRLVKALDGPMSIALNDRRERLLMAVQGLLAESAITAQLVRYALDFNNKLMAILTGVEDEGSVYSGAGEVRSLGGERSAACTGLVSSTFEHSA